MPLATNKFCINGLIVFATVAAIAYTYGATARSKVVVFLGNNAYIFQEEAGFPMGYPTPPDELGPIGGSMQNIDAYINLGPIEISCKNAYLALYRIADLVSSGEIYCPLKNNLDEVANLHVSISSSWKWDRYEDFMLSPRRAAAFGDDIEAAFTYLEKSPLQGAVLRIPLYSWLDDDGIYVELNATRNAKTGGGSSYEVKFSWGVSCLLDAEAGSASQQQGDEPRAAQNRRRVAEICPNVPAAFLPPPSG